MARGGGGDFFPGYMWAPPLWPHRCHASQHLCNFNGLRSSFSIYYHKCPNVSPHFFSCRSKHRHNHTLCYTFFFQSCVFSSVSSEGASQCLIWKLVFPPCSAVLFCFFCFLFLVTLQGKHSLDFFVDRVRFFSLSQVGGESLFVLGRASMMKQCGRPGTHACVYGLSWAGDVGGGGGGGMVRWWGWLLG